jgi:hypothetical protein
MSNFSFAVCGPSFVTEKIEKFMVAPAVQSSTTA